MSLHVLTQDSQPGGLLLGGPGTNTKGAPPKRSSTRLRRQEKWGNPGGAREKEPGLWSQGHTHTYVTQCLHTSK